MHATYKPIPRKRAHTITIHVGSYIVGGKTEIIFPQCITCLIPAIAIG